MAAELSGAAVLILLSFGSCSCLLVLITTAVLLFLACLLFYKKIQVFDIPLEWLTLVQGGREKTNVKPPSSLGKFLQVTLQLLNASSMKPLNIHLNPFLLSKTLNHTLYIKLVFKCRCTEKQQDYRTFRKISTFSSALLIRLLMQESIPGWDGV